MIRVVMGKKNGPPLAGRGHARPGAETISNGKKKREGKRKYTQAKKKNKGVQKRRHGNRINQNNLKPRKTKAGTGTEIPRYVTQGWQASKK